ncbi:autotransporter outer membrane beta-barrel domain-containing protein [Enterobacter ludwigii]|nr:autotransporter outer membrane beta-barrel domain-containing protein [Enterobacter ludwigii]
MLTISNGASVNSDGSVYVGYGDSYYNGTGTGTVLVNNGATLNSKNVIHIGYGVGHWVVFTSNQGYGYGYGTGTGTLTVDNGASVNSDIAFYIGYGEGYDGYSRGYGYGYGYGSLTVNNGASVSSGGDIYVGYGNNFGKGYGYGDGTLIADNGALVVTGTDIVAGYAPDSGIASGVLTVSRDARLEAGVNVRLYNGALNIGAKPEDAATGAGAVSVGTAGYGGAVELHTGTFSDGSAYAGQVNFNHTNTDYVFTPDITGEGFVRVYEGHTTLTGNNTWAGYTEILGGTLQAGGDGVFSKNADYYMTSGGVLDLNGYSQTIGSFSSDGTVYFNQKGDSAGTVLTVDGNYHGYGGTLVFNAVLGGDDSVTDTLHVTGNVDGGTNVKVNNLGGLGSQTVEGVKLITVEGDIASGTEFRQAGRIVAGAYDYRLVQGGQGGSSSSWYLTSGFTPVDPVDPIDPVDPKLPEPPVPLVRPEVSITRPEAGSYIANLTASEMFFTRLEDRGREHIYTDAVTGEKKLTSMWLRSEGRHLDNHDSSGQLSTRENRYAIQMGGDVTDGTFTGADSWRLGVMAGYGNSHSNTRSDITGYQSKGDTDGYTMGLYGTWYENADRRSGAWVDTWLQYAWFSNSVQGEGLAEEKYNSGGLQASVETGYAFVVPGGKNLDYIIEPQAQAIWNGVKTDEFRESNGTVVKSEGTSNVHTRLGVKGSMDIRSGDKSDVVWKPYVAVNWHHNTKEYGVRMDDVSLSVSGAKDTVELKAGVEGQLTEKLSVWGGVSGKAGSDSYRDRGGFLGVRYGF